MSPVALSAALPAAPYAAALDLPPFAVELVAERPVDGVAVDALIGEAFGPGRFAKTAERVRELAVWRPELSICAWADGELAGAVRLWSVRIGEAPALFLGPIAVAAHLRGRGIAARLVERACAEAAQLGERMLLLVGDLARFGPMGFAPVPTGLVTTPGPIDPRRLLWRELDDGAAAEMAGPLRGPAA